MDDAQGDWDFGFTENPTQQQHQQQQQQQQHQQQQQQQQQHTQQQQQQQRQYLIPRRPVPNRSAVTSSQPLLPQDEDHANKSELISPLTSAFSSAEGPVGDGKQLQSYFSSISSRSSNHDNSIHAVDHASDASFSVQDRNSHILDCAFNNSVAPIPDTASIAQPRSLLNYLESRSLIEEDENEDGIPPSPTLSPPASKPKTGPIRNSPTPQPSPQHSQPGSLRRPHRRPRLQSNRILSTSKWFYQVFSWFLSLLIFIALIFLLYAYNQRAMPDWPHGITLNAVIAILTTAGKAFLMAPVTDSMAQLKWLFFKKRDGRLTEFDRIDAASRGETGCLNLVVRRHTGPALIGALITLAALVASTMAQQLVNFPSRRVALVNNGTIDTATQRCVNYTVVPTNQELGSGRSPTVSLSLPVTQSMKAAVFSGTFLDVNKSFPLLTPTCATGNCNWPPFRSLGFCHHFANVTSNLSNVINKANRTSSRPTWMTTVFNQTTEIPAGSGGAAVYVHNLADLHIFPQGYIGPDTHPGPEPGLWPDVRIPTTHFFAYFLPNNTDRLPSITVYEAEIYPCVHEHKIAIESGNLVATATEVPSEKSGGYFPSFGYQHLQTLDDGQVYSLYFLPLYTFLSFFFQGSWNIFTGGAIVTGTNTPDTFSAIAFAGAKNVTMIDNLLANLATSMSNEIRSSGDILQNISGTVYGTETFVDVRWGWLAFQAALIVASGIFLLMTIVQSERQGVEAWKSSSLATIWAREGIQGVHILEDIAEKSIVSLGRTHEGDSWVLKRVALVGLKEK